MIYDINTYIAMDGRLKQLSGKSELFIEPAVGYELEDGPVITWWYYPGIKSRELFFWRMDRLRYCIFDTDAARVIAMGERLIQLLNLGDDSRTSIYSANYHTKWSFLATGRFDGPTKKEGWYKFDIEADVSWTPNAPLTF
jgi:hypothetical protein